MKRSGSSYYFFVQVVIFFLSLVTDLYVPLLFALSVTVLMSVFDKLGKGIVLRELIAFHSCFVCLIMPWVGYEWYTISNPLARLWVRYMPVSADTYFAFAVPAIAAFVVALCWPIRGGDVDDEGEYIYKYILRAKVILQRSPYTGLYLVVGGILISFAANYLPVALQFVANLLGWAAFAGILYIYFTPSLPYRLPAMLLFVVYIIFQALHQGMFTIVAYMGITIFSFFFLQRKSPMWKKLTMFVVAVFLLFIIQSVKSTFRRYTWYDNYGGNKAVLFGNLVSEKLTTFSDLFTQEAIFPIYYRTNQGFNVGLVMKKFPEFKDFDYGTNLGRDLASSFVPRFLWPDKPEAGGKFNMLYYCGIVLRGWSTNVGPLGEAYGSFGVVGGIIYMFVLGLFIRWAYSLIFRIARKIPLLVFWIPVLFFQVTYSAENDTLQILNSLLKSAFLIWILYKGFPAVFGLGKALRQKRPTLVPG